jgi:hypothetical protein
MVTLGSGRGITSCEQSGYDPADHFARARKMIGLGKGGVREVVDCGVA